MKKTAPNISAWSHSVQDRDRHKCVICGDPSLHAHHIFPRARFPHKEREIDNGVSLCKQCHQLAHRGWTGATGKTKRSCYYAFSQLLARSDGGDKTKLCGLLVIGDASNSLYAYKQKNDTASAAAIWAEIEKICTLLNCQPGDLLERVPAEYADLSDDKSTDITG